MFGQRQHILIREEKAVREVRSHRVTNIALPKRTPKRRVVRFVGVLRRFADREHPANPDDHPPRLLREGSPLAVEEAKGLFRTERTEESIEHRQLVLAFLDPGGFDFVPSSIADVRLAIRSPAQSQTFCDPDVVVLHVPLNLLTQHPAVRYACRGVRGLKEACRPEVPVGLRVDLRVRVRYRAGYQEGCHEGRALPNTRRKVSGGDLVHTLPGATCLNFVAGVPRRYEEG